MAGRGEGRVEGQPGEKETEKVGGAQRRRTVNVQDVTAAQSVNRKEARNREDAEAAIGALQSGSALL